MGRAPRERQHPVCHLEAGSHPQPEQGDTHTMDSYTSALTAQIGTSWQAQKDLLSAAATENRSLTPEEREQVDRMDSDLDQLLEERKRFEDRARIMAAADTFREEVAPRVEAARSQRREATDSEMIRAIVPGGMDYREFKFRPQSEVRALQSEGGSAVPTSFADLVSVYMRTVDPIWDMAEVLDTSGAAPLVIPRLTTDAAGGGTVTAENGGITVADATISQITLNAFRYASIQPVSYQLWRDSAFDLTNLLAKSGGRQIGIAAGSAMAFANGSSGPNGYVAGGSAGATATGTASGTAFDTFFSPADIVDLYHSVVPGWRAVGSWMMATTALTKVRKFRDSQGMFQYDPGIAGAPQPTLLGRPIYESPSLAAVASATKSVIFGDWSQYVIRRVPLRVDVSTEAYFTVDGVGVRIILETDGDILHPTAIRPLVSANT
jgi:HK97 family phage major capsid protein